MLMFITAPFTLVGALSKSRRNLAVENLALRQQLAALKHSTTRVRLRRTDRIFWVWLSELCANWRSLLVIVQPGTVVRWHQLGFRLYWARKSRLRKVGRPRIQRRLRQQIRRMCRENPLWGAPRILSSYVDVQQLAPASVAGPQRSQSTRAVETGQRQSHPV